MLRDCPFICLLLLLTIAGAKPLCAAPQPAFKTKLSSGADWRFLPPSNSCPTDACSLPSLAAES